MKNAQKSSGKDSARNPSGKRSSSSRPKTSTQRLDDILSDDLRNFGSRLSTPSFSEVGGVGGNLRSKGVKNFSDHPPLLAERESDSSRLIHVGHKSQERGRATLIQQNIDTAGSSAMSRRDFDSRTKVDSFLEQEQDELAMSLSQSKFLMLRNANIERVKADEKWPDLDELRQVEKIKTKFNLTNFNDTEEIADEVPDDTFKNIPDDVFEKIPRAVTARIQNRERKKLRSSSGRAESESPTSASASQLAPSAPLAEGEVSAAGQPVGFIAMLFSGGSVARPGNIDQIEKDFMFAVFLQKQEEEEREGSPGQSGQSRRRDPELGHFCAPDMPGFCEANFCIFHSKK